MLEDNPKGAGPNIAQVKMISSNANRKKRSLVSRVSALSFAALLASGSIATVAGASARSSEDKTSAAKKKAKVVPDFAYFAGKTITFITPGSPGGSNWDAASILAPLMASYLHCTINIEDIPQGGSIPAQNTTAAQAPNALTIGWMGPPGDILNSLTNVAGVNFTMQKQVILGAIPGNDEVLISRSGSNFPKLGDVMRAKTPISILNATTGIVDVSTLTFLGAYKIPTHIIYGFTNATTQYAGFLSGDGPVEFAQVSTSEPGLLAGQAKPLLQYLPPLKGTSTYNLLKKVPTIASLLKTDPPKSKAAVNALKEAIDMVGYSNDVLFAPTGTNADEAAALTAAFRSALAQKGAQAAELNDGLSSGYIDPATALKDIHNEVTGESSILPYLTYQG
jgi:tripartite-type tricarboxylate transporter receptor subunit TctC